MMTQTGFFLTISDSSNRNYMKSQSLTTTLSLTNTVASYSIGSSSNLVGGTTNLFLQLGLTALLQPSINFEVSASGLDFSAATVTNPSTTLLSKSASKIKVQVTGFKSPLAISNVLNQVGIYHVELHQAWFSYGFYLRHE